jgi:WD40 repeat protein
MKKFFLTMIIFLFLLSACANGEVGKTLEFDQTVGTDQVRDASSAVDYEQTLTPSESPVPATATPLPQPIRLSKSIIGQLSLYGVAELNNPYRLDWSHDGHFLGALTPDGLTVIDVEMLQPITTVLVTDPINVMDFSVDGKVMLTVSDPYQIDIRDLATGEIQRSIEIPGGVMNAVISNDGKFIAVPSFEAIEVQIFSVEGGQLIKIVNGFETAAPVYHVQFSKNDQYLLWVSRNNVQAMNLENGQLGAKLSHEQGVVDAVLALDNGHLAVSTAGTIDGDFVPVIKIWDAHGGQELGLIRTLDPGIAYSIDFSVDNQMLAAGDGSFIRIWDVNTLRLLYENEAHGDSINSIAFSPDGRFLASTSPDNTIKIWQVLGK